MGGMDETWAVNELKLFLRDSEPVSSLSYERRESEIVFAARAWVAEQILDRVLPEWRAGPRRTGGIGARWDHLRDWAAAGVAAVERREELRDRMGDDLPILEPSELHPWVWEGARSLWGSRHYAEAIAAAARKVNAELQNKLNRRDLGETRLFQEAFTINAPEPDRPRLRLTPDDGSPSFRSRQAGASDLARALYGGLRNPASHDVLDELDRHEALEQLAAFSVLARMVDRAVMQIEGNPH